MATKEYLRNKEGSNISKIVVDRDLCIGAALYRSFRRDLGIR